MQLKILHSIYVMATSDNECNVSFKMIQIVLGRFMLKYCLIFKNFTFVSNNQQFPEFIFIIKFSEAPANKRPFSNRICETLCQMVCGSYLVNINQHLILPYFTNTSILSKYHLRIMFGHDYSQNIQF